ncbi:MAG: nucleotide exchange factor GrpE [Thermodesulfobacteriota bacterium]
MTDSVNQGGERPAQEGEQPTVAPEGVGEQANLAADLEKAREEAKDLQDRLLRLAAEFENFKKRMQRERETAMKYAEEGLLRELLPSLDNLERAVEQGRSSGEGASLLEGVEMTLSGLRNTLEKFGLKPVDGVGQPFDPNLHEALAMEASDTVAPNTILQEYQKGYMFKDRLLRAAKVVVAKAGE